jgi:glutamate N-acetyltransferase/amino-acid N-acetyltransferase
VFTQNKFFAPPVDVEPAGCANGGQVAAVIVNSGNANAGTGPAWMADADAMCAAAAGGAGLSAYVLVCSTGIIGTPLPDAAILPRHAQLAASCRATAAASAARAS